MGLESCGMSFSKPAGVQLPLIREVYVAELATFNL
jgi:hypothetical protein